MLLLHREDATSVIYVMQIPTTCTLVYTYQEVFGSPGDEDDVDDNNKNNDSEATSHRVLSMS